MKIGAAIKQVRLERGVTQEAIALDAGTFAGNISKIERDQQLPSLELLEKIATALNIKLSELFVLAEEKSGHVTARSASPTARNCGNAAILVRRHFLSLDADNQLLAVELLKTLNRVQRQQV